MCNNKLQINNPVLPAHRTGFDKLRLQVPCNKCKECLEQRSADWLVRAYYEMQSYLCTPFFCTLTYDDDHLPKFNDKPCFDYNDVKGFFKRLRYYIGEFRYLLTCEYGGFLHRPHYHFLLFPKSSVSYDFFLRSLCHCWTLGEQVRVSEVSASSQMNRLEAISYITGYCTKDIDFDASTFNDDIPYRYRPRTQASKGFGAHDFSQEEFERGYIFLPLGNDGISYKYTIPKYYYMRVFYDYSYDPNTRKSSLTRNARGVELAKLQHNRCYVYHVSEVLSSKSLGLENHPYVSFPLLSGFRTWADCIYFLYEDVDDFSEYMYLRDFLDFLPVEGSRSFDGKVRRLDLGTEKHYDLGYSYLCHRLVYSRPYYNDLLLPIHKDMIFDSLHKEFVYRPRWHAYKKIVDCYYEYKSYLDKSQYESDKQELLNSSRKRAIEKLKRNKSLFNYLRYVKNYDFEKELGVNVSF